MFARSLNAPSTYAPALSLLVAVLALGCGSKPPPEPAVPTSPDAVVSTAPAPRCEALGEACKARGDTQARIAGAGVVFTPVVGWFYAQGTGATVAQASDNGPAVAFVGFDPPDAKDSKKEQAAREATFEGLLRELNIPQPKNRLAWKKPSESKPVAGLKGSFWQLDLVSRGVRTGPLIVFTALLASGKEVMGIGFVPDDDKSDADVAIIKSMDTIRPGDGK